MPENEAVGCGPAERPKRLDVAVTSEGRSIVERAITLRLATLACVESDCRELAGEALVGICREWTRDRVEELRRAKGGQA